MWLMGWVRTAGAAPRNGPGVLATSGWAYITTAGSRGCACWSRSSSTRPSSPGMRTSVKSSCGGGRVASASSTAAAASTPTTSKPASLSAVASTKQIGRASFRVIVSQYVMIAVVAVSFITKKTFIYVITLTPHYTTYISYYYNNINI